MSFCHGKILHLNLTSCACIFAMGSNLRGPGCTSTMRCRVWKLNYPNPAKLATTYSFFSAKPCAKPWWDVCDGDNSDGMFWDVWDAHNPGGMFGMGTTKVGVFWDVWDALNPGGMGGVSCCRSQCARRKTGGVRVSQQPIRWQTGNEHLLGGNGWPWVRPVLGSVALIRVPDSLR